VIVTRRILMTSLAAAAIALGGPPAGAGAAIITTAPAPCANIAGPEGQGGTGQTINQICTGDGGVAVGPSTGQVTRVVGPAITGPGVAGPVIVSAGDVAVV
jgi:hypothetical protein